MVLWIDRVSQKLGAEKWNEREKNQQGFGVAASMEIENPRKVDNSLLGQGKEEHHVAGATASILHRPTTGINKGKAHMHPRNGQIERKGPSGVVSLYEE